MTGVASPSSQDGASHGRLRRLGIAAGILAVAGSAAGCGQAVPVARTTNAPAQIEAQHHAVTRGAIVATVRRSRISVYRNPRTGGAFAHFGRSNGFGQPRVFLVAERRPGWEKVYLPMRPDGITGWVRDSDVSLAYDPYRVVVSLGRHHVWVYDGDRRVMSIRAGVGRSITATPTGTYFLVMLLKQPDPNGVYGPYAFGTSAFSHVYYSFGGGPGEIGLHGTDFPQGLGTNVSHGCIRVSNTVITRLAKLLPLGTPVLIKD